MKMNDRNNPRNNRPTNRDDNRTKDDLVYFIPNLFKPSRRRHQKKSTIFLNDSSCDHLLDKLLKR